MQCHATIQPILVNNGSYYKSTSLSAGDLDTVWAVLTRTLRKPVRPTAVEKTAARKHLSFSVNGGRDPPDGFPRLIAQLW
jgi:hypothetical protein